MVLQPGTLLIVVGVVIVFASLLVMPRRRR